MSDNIQHKAALVLEVGYGFENGQRVPIVLPQIATEADHCAVTKEEERRIQLEAVTRLLNSCLRAANAESLWRAIQVTGFTLKLAESAHNHDELAKRLGVQRRHAYNLTAQANPLILELFPREQAADCTDGLGVRDVSPE